MVENPQNQAETGLLAADFNRIWNQLPDWMGDKPRNAALAGSREGAAPVVRAYWPQSFLQGDLNVPLTPGALILDDKGEVPDKVRQIQWRRWIWLFNTLQSLPGSMLTTSMGLENRDYDALPKPTAPAKASTSSPSASRWEEVFNQTVESVREELRVLAEAGLSAPDQIGYEYADEAGRVVAEAELAWESAHVVVLVGSQEEYAEIWESLGWKPVIAGAGWPSVLISEVQATRKAGA
jgi:DEAD/DEAH box helicase domain-containing protein